MSAVFEEIMREGEAIGLAKGESIGLAKGESIGLAKGELKLAKTMLKEGRIKPEEIPAFFSTLTTDDIERIKRETLQI